MEEIILVDSRDRVVGPSEKIDAHRNGGRLHRAFSIFIFNTRSEMLQRRSPEKYHFSGKWANACCGHPRWGESLDEASHRRLREELGFDTKLRRVFSFTYIARDAESCFTEREFDHVFVGAFDGEPDPDPDEIADLRWVRPANLERELRTGAEHYAPWFVKALPRLMEFS